MAKYKTIQDISTGEFKDRGSKFIAYAKAIYSEEEAKVFVEGVWKEHHKARHVCYAYKIGTNNQLIRTNDDGEPSNTGGQPILNYINKYELSNVIIAVVRYFGGVLLGKGGLINAYGTAAEEALKSSKVILKSEMIKVELQLPFDDFSKVMDIIKGNGIKVISEAYTQQCSLQIQLEKDYFEQFKDLVSGLKINEINKISDLI